MSTAQSNAVKVIALSAASIALLLTAGQLAGQVMRTLLQSHSFQRFHRLLLVDHGMVVLRHHHVLHRRQMRHEVELLEH